MSLTGSILEYLPDYIPKSDIKVDVTDEFEYRSSSTPKTVYKIEKGPVKRIDELTATVSGTTRNFVVGEEVKLRDTTGDARYDSIAFIDSDVLPDDETEFEATYVIEPLISRYVSSFDEDIDIVGDRIDDSIDAKYINSASGRELDRIGASYGNIGRRLGREDPEYRSFLRSIADAFDATGTKSGIKFVAGAVLEADPDDIEVVEDFDQTAFTVRAEQPEAAVITESFNSLIELSSPSGVGLYQPPSLYTRATEFSSTSTTFLITDESVGLGSSFISEDGPEPVENKLGLLTFNTAFVEHVLGRISTSISTSSSEQDLGRILSVVSGSTTSTQIPIGFVGIESSSTFADATVTDGFGSDTISSDGPTPVENGLITIAIKSVLSYNKLPIGFVEINTTSVLKKFENIGSSTISSGSTLN